MIGISPPGAASADSPGRGAATFDAIPLVGPLIQWGPEPGAPPGRPETEGTDPMANILKRIVRFILDWLRSKI